MNRSALLLLSLLCVLGPRVARADDDALTRFRDWVSNLGKPKPPPPEDLGARNTFTINPLALRYQQLGVEYERAFGKPLSVYVGPEFAYGRTDRSWNLSLGGTLGLRLFVLGNAPSGIYFGPEFSVRYLRRHQDGTLEKAYGLGLGGTVGWTLVLFNRFTLAAGFSAQYRATPDLDSPEPGALKVEIIPNPRLAFGVAF